MSAISGLATEIYQNEFEGNQDIVPRSYIEAWLTSNLGMLNSLINTSYSGASAELDLESQAIYKNLYLSSYYTRQSSASLRGVIGSGGSDVLSIRDGNSAVTFANRNEIAKVFKSMSDGFLKEAKTLAHQYNMYQSEPIQVAGDENTI